MEMFKIASPRVRKYHKARLMSPTGEVSPVCADVPKAIDLRKSLWTTRWEDVTCKKCLARQG
jgi:hypothetical protein